MASKRATILDVAARAGVSTTTASDALRGRGRIADATREAVERAAHEIGYVPNRAARSLRAAESGVIGLHLPATMSRSEFYLAAAYGILEQSARAEYDVTLLASRRSAVAPRVDGVILCDPVVGDPVTERLLKLGVPIVSMERVLDSDALMAIVTADYEGAVRSLLAHMHERGARSVTLLGATEATDWAQRALATFQTETARLGIAAHVVLRPIADSDDSWRDAAAEALATGSDAVLAGPPVGAHAVLAELAERGEEPGGDVLLACIVDAPALANGAVPVTAVDLEPRGSGRACVTLLLDVLAQRAAPDAVVPVSTELRVRASTGGAHA